ncbi:MAG: hypothetical protein FWD17_05110 [Polyangiaceae bacterium]|nr:hypothetical protein [Polyangiaceae bacterium]
MSWDGVVRLRGEALDALAARHGGCVVAGRGEAPRAFSPIERAGQGDLAPLIASRFVAAAREAAQRGACLIVDANLSHAVREAPGLWIHEHAGWVTAELLDEAIVPEAPAVVGAGSSIAASAVLGPRVLIGARVTVGPGAVIGHPGFGWATGPRGAVRAVPQLGGVVIEDDVSIGPLTTIDAGTLSPTRVRRGAKLDAHVHVGHNVEIGERTIVAAQCGFAGSVKVGADVLVGGQAGIADHVVVGDGARIAAKAGVIGDVPARAVVAGYPAVTRMRWLRGLAKLYAGIKGEP